VRPGCPPCCFPATKRVIHTPCALLFPLQVEGPPPGPRLPPGHVLAVIGVPLRPHGGSSSTSSTSSSSSSSGLVGQLKPPGKQQKRQVAHSELFMEAAWRATQCAELARVPISSRSSVPGLALSVLLTVSSFSYDLVPRTLFIRLASREGGMDADRVASHAGASTSGAEKAPIKRYRRAELDAEEEEAKRLRLLEE